MPDGEPEVVGPAPPTPRSWEPPATAPTPPAAPTVPIPGPVAPPRSRPVATGWTPDGPAAAPTPQAGPPEPPDSGAGWTPGSPDGAGEAPPTGEVAPSGAVGARTGLRALLPDTVRGGRLDPGRRGAVALVVVAVLAAALTAAAVYRARPQPVAAPSVERSGAALPGAGGKERPADVLVVSVAGTVVTPGLVRLPPGSRVDDAVRAAGGLSPGADVGLLNLARELVDGEQVLVGVGPPPAAGGAAAGGGGALDLNAATADDLDGLPGIGPVLAQRIVDRRTAKGPFRSVDELREVPGIGEAKFTLLEKKVRV